MHEIVTSGALTQLFLALAILSPFVGVATAALLHTRRRDRFTVSRTGLLVGLAGPANWLLWRLYNTLTDHNGLDTVRNFVLNLAVFILIGLGLGLALGRLQPPAETEASAVTVPLDPQESPDEGGQDCRSLLSVTGSVDPQ